MGGPFSLGDAKSEAAGGAEKSAGGTGYGSGAAAVKPPAQGRDPPGVDDRDVEGGKGGSTGPSEAEPLLAGESAPRKPWSNPCHGWAAHSGTGTPAELRSALLRMYISIVLCFICMMVEFIGGGIANSLCLMTDAAHLLSDLVGYAIGIAALHRVNAKTDPEFTYGLVRVELVGALFSVILIWLVAVILIVVACYRLIYGSETRGVLMLVIALFGFAINCVLLLALGHGSSFGHDGCAHEHGPKRKGKKSNKADIAEIVTGNSNMNVRAAFAHVVGDLITSITAICAAIIICVHPHWRWADPIATIVSGVLAMVTPIPLMIDLTHVVLLRAPKDIDIYELKEMLRGIDGVVHVHCLHVWDVMPGKTVLAVHLVVSRQANPNLVLSAANELLASAYGTIHSTIQVTANRTLCDPRKALGEDSCGSGPFKIAGVAAEAEDPNEDPGKRLFEDLGKNIAAWGTAFGATDGEAAQGGGV